MSIIELSQLGQDLFDFSGLSLPINSPIHPKVGVSPQIINLQTKSNYINKFKLYQISHLTWPHPLTHPPTHPPNYTAILGWGILNRFQIFKQNWNISISSSAIEFSLIPGVPPGGGDQVDGSGGWWKGAPTHMHMHAHAHAYTCVWHHREFPGFPSMGAAICMKLSCLPRMHVHVCGGTPIHPPTTPPTPIHPPPTPQSHRESESPKFNKSFWTKSFWTNQDNSILFEDSLPLNIPQLI